MSRNKTKNQIASNKTYSYKDEVNTKENNDNEHEASLDHINIIDQGNFDRKSSINTLKLNIEDEITGENLDFINKVSFLSSDAFHEENAGSSSASDKHSITSFSKDQKVALILNKKFGKKHKSKGNLNNSPKKNTFRESINCFQAIENQQPELLCTPRSSVGNRSNELNKSPISDDKSIKHIEHNFNKQKLTIIQLQERLDKEIESKQQLETRIQSLISGKQQHLIKIVNLLDSIKDKDKEREELVKENSELRNKVDEFMALQHKSDNSKLSKLAMELDQKDSEMREIINEKSIEVQELKMALDAKQSTISKQRSIIDEK